LKNHIDYFFVSDHFEVLKYAVLTDAKDQRYPSDHLPVVATINFLKWEFDLIHVHNQVGSAQLTHQGSNGAAIGDFCESSSSGG